jgi:large subunit ribosomal protein L25
MSDVNTLDATVRTEFGKGAARRTRRDGKVPAVLYGHQSEPKHLALDAHDFAAILRKDGSNAVLSLRIEGKTQLALTKSVVVHPVRRYIEHADLLVVRRGEKVTVDVPVVIAGDAFPGALVTQEETTVSVEAEALHIPESIEISVEGAEIGTQIHASDLPLPSGVTLATEPETLVVNVLAPAVDAAAEEAAATESQASEEGEAAAE